MAVGRLNFLRQRILSAAAIPGREILRTNVFTSFFAGAAGSAVYKSFFKRDEPPPLDEAVAMTIISAQQMMISLPPDEKLGYKGINVEHEKVEGETRRTRFTILRDENSPITGYCDVSRDPDKESIRGVLRLGTNESTSAVESGQQYFYENFQGSKFHVHFSRNQNLSASLRDSVC